MTKTTQMADAIVNEQADLLARRLDDGYLRIYTGTQPASADTAITTQTLLVTLRFDNPSAPAAVGGLLSFADLLVGVAVATGSAAWARLFESDGTTAVMDGSVGLSGADPNFVISNTSIATGTGVVMTGLTHEARNAATGY